MLSHVWLFVTLWTVAFQASWSFTVSWHLLNSCPLNRSCHPTIVIFFCPLFLLPLIFPIIRFFFFFQWVDTSHQVVKVLELELQRQSFNEYSEFISFSYWLVWSPCCPRNSQEFPPAPQFEGINVIILTCYKDSLRKYIIHIVFLKYFNPALTEYLLSTVTCWKCKQKKS